jgi:hypothetical protein
MKTGYTCTVMVMCHGDTGESWYHVMRGSMRRGKFTPKDTVASYKFNRGEKPNYEAMTATHATPQFPPVPWQRVERQREWFEI